MAKQKPNKSKIEHEELLSTIRQCHDLIVKIWSTWSFGSFQDPTHSWHDKADLAPEVAAVVNLPAVKLATELKKAKRKR